MPFILPISSAFAHTRCISPSVCLLKSFMQASTFAPSPLAAHASACAILAFADGSGLPFSLHPPPAALKSQTPQREARALPRQRTESKNAAHFFTLHYCFPAAHAVSPLQRFWWNPQGGRAAPRQVPPPKQRLLNPQQRQRRRAAPAGFFLR